MLYMVLYAHMDYDVLQVYHYIPFPPFEVINSLEICRYLPRAKLSGLHRGHFAAILRLKSRYDPLAWRNSQTNKTWDSKFWMPPEIRYMNN